VPLAPVHTPLVMKSARYHCGRTFGSGSAATGAATLDLGMRCGTS
jgi:hypothetical protein